MVVIHLKSSSDEFLYETSCNESNDSIVRELTEIWNTRIRLKYLCNNMLELSKYGPMKPLDKAGLDEIDEEYRGVQIEKNEY